MCWVCKQKLIYYPNYINKKSLLLEMNTAKFYDNLIGVVC